MWYNKHKPSLTGSFCERSESVVGGFLMPLTSDQKMERQRLAVQRFREKHPDRQRLATQRYRKAHPEREKATKRAYYAAHKEKMLAYSKAYRKTHKEWYG